MYITPKSKNKKIIVASKKIKVSATANLLQQQAFTNSLQANIITAIRDGKIIMVNRAACKLLGYSKKELLTKTKASIFDIKELSFKKMLKEIKAKRHSIAQVTAIKKSGEKIPCEITSALFKGEHGIEKSIMTIADRSQTILLQRNIDAGKEKAKNDNIILAILKQKKIDVIKEKIVADNIVLAELKQKRIDTKKEKIVADNIILAQKKSDARLARNNEWRKYIAKTSYDVMWDWNIVTGEIYVGDSVEEVFGYKVQNNTVYFNHFRRCLITVEKNIVEKKLLKTLGSNSRSWNDSFRFKRYDGSFASTTIRGSIVRDDQGKAIQLIGAIQDVSKLRELEKKLHDQVSIQKENGDIFLEASRLSFDGIWHWNLLTDEFFLSDSFEELFGYATKNSIGNIDTDWANYFHPDDKEAIKKSLYDSIASSDTYWENTHRFIKADGSIARVINSASIIRNKSGKACRIIGIMHDISGKTEKKDASFALMNDKKPMLIEKIKNIIVDMVHHSDEQLQTNFSDYLSKKLQYDYTYLSNFFSEMENISIQKFIIAQKIERAKELMTNPELTLTQIALRLHYSSVAHLSNQFKKVTGVTPSYFKQLHHL